MKLEKFDYEKAILSGMSKNIGESILLIPIWTEEFCDLLIETASSLNYESLEADLSAYGAAPGQEVRVSTFSSWLLNNWKKHCLKYILPVVGEFYRAGYMFEKPYDIFRDPFIIKYDVKGQTTLNEHHDFSLLTINMCLSKRDRDFTGSEVVFPRQNWTTAEVPRGWGIAFPGQLTHPHYTNPIISGTRYGWVSWIRGSDLQNVNP